ncbi:hypothetical protein HCZ87_17665 [Phaeobacter sp. HF9A]|nr:hypothetical protein [Phaeobacter sp. HF9A]
MGPGDVYRVVQQSDEDFLIIEGQLDFDQNLLPTYSESRPAGASKPVEVPAQLTGLLLGERIFDQPLEGEITLEAHCLGPWCGKLTPGNRYLFFARQVEGRVVAVVEPCGGFFFDAADGTAGDIVLQCHRGGVCPSQLPDTMEGVIEVPGAAD